MSIRCGSGRWVHAQLPMDELPRGLGRHRDDRAQSVVNGENFAVRNLRVRKDARDTARAVSWAGTDRRPVAARRRGAPPEDEYAAVFPDTPGRDRYLRAVCRRVRRAVVCGIDRVSTGEPPPPRTTCRISTIVDRRVAISCSVGRVRARKRYAVQIGRAIVARGTVATNGRIFARRTLRSRLTPGRGSLPRRRQARRNDRA